MQPEELNLPLYRCHKEVKAARIEAIGYSPTAQTFYLRFGDGQSVTVPQTWLEKHQPCVGGYYVIYGDGYTSFSPAAAFETGYALTSPVVTSK